MVWIEGPAMGGDCGPPAGAERISADPSVSRNTAQDQDRGGCHITSEASFYSNRVRPARQGQGCGEILGLGLWIARRDLQGRKHQQTPLQDGAVAISPVRRRGIIGRRERVWR